MSRALPLLPSRDLGFLAFPQRESDARPTPLLDGWRRLAATLRPSAVARLPPAHAETLRRAAASFALVDDVGLARHALRARTRLRARRLDGRTGIATLALVAEFARRRLGLRAYPSQLLAAWLMLDGRFVEMATGEGKTLAAGLAAATAALAGMPVHLLTANDYLVQRDHDQMAPLYQALGLTSARVLPAMDRAGRHAAYRCDIVLLTARELAFDYLRDHLMLAGVRDPGLLRAAALQAGAAAAAEPVLPGLCFAIVDEADSILLDEASMPMILAQPADPVELGSYRRALEVAGALRRGRDYALEPRRRTAELSDDGRRRVAEAVQDDAGLLRPLRRAHELVETALVARHLMQRERDYAVVDGRLQLIDDVTGRIADGRQWTGALQPMVELKEGLEPSPSTRVAAQITYQRFFPRYLRLAGMSGTLHESRAELREAYDARVQRVPLARPSLRRWHGQRLYADTVARDTALVERVRALVAAGRPVLVGTDSVGASHRIAARLRAAGIAHEVLNAVQDDREAECIACAGQSGRVTVATNIAGRGTDIRLDAAALAAGGLHVIATMRNRSARIDRQLVGRAARHGDPGSAESMLALDDRLLAHAWPAALRRAAARAARARVLPRWLAAPLAGLAQRRADGAEQAARRQLRHADSHDEELFGFAGGVE